MSIIQHLPTTYKRILIGIGMIMCIIQILAFIAIIITTVVILDGKLSIMFIYLLQGPVFYIILAYHVLAKVYMHNEEKTNN